MRTGMAGKMLNNKFLISLLSGALILLHVLWESYHGGVTSHNLLAREDLPAISNWWGVVSLPILTWITLNAIEVRAKKANSASTPVFKSARGFFIGGLIFGLTMAALWQYNMEEFMPYLLLLPLVLALWIPTYRLEGLLGFVLGMAYTFGGVLPIMIGLVLLLLSFIVYKGIRGGIRALIRMIGK